MVICDRCKRGGEGVEVKSFRYADFDGGQVRDAHVCRACAAELVDGVLRMLRNELPVVTRTIRLPRWPVWPAYLYSFVSSVVIAGSSPWWMPLAERLLRHLTGR
jgi:hypothetical protein